jgi:hypothetical protein
MMVWVTKPGDENVPGMNSLGEEVGRLDHVSEVDAGLKKA